MESGRLQLGSQPISSRADHWQDLWNDPQNDGEIMGGLAARPALESVWRSFLETAALCADDLVLDIASGAAPIARGAADLPAASRPNFACVDYAPAALSAARALGARIICCVADANRLPFRPGSFSAVVSQFGLEYAGGAAFSEAASALRPGAPLLAIVHAEGGAIALESGASERVVAAALEAGLIRAARKTLTASYDDAPAGYVSKKREAGFQRTLGAVRSLTANAPPSPGAAILARYAADIERLAARRFAFEPEDALGWLQQIEQRLKAYLARLRAMQQAARSSQDMDEISTRLAGVGLVDISVEPVQFRAGDAQGAWRLSARRPA